MDLNGNVVRAALNEVGAPQTCEAVWKALPFEGTAVHAQISGQMFRMLEPAPVPDLALENREYFQHPGELVFYPPIKEIAFCVGEARFSATQGFTPCTRLGLLEGDIAAWAAVGDGLAASGSGHIRFSASPDQASQFRWPIIVGSAFTLKFGDAHVSGVLTNAALAEAIGKSGPVNGQAVNSKWGGNITRIRFDGQALRDAMVEVAGAARTGFHWPGYIYLDPTDLNVLVCYGDGCESVNGHPRELVTIGRITADLGKFAEVARGQLRGGALGVVLQ